MCQALFQANRSSSMKIFRNGKLKVTEDITSKCKTTEKDIVSELLVQLPPPSPGYPRRQHWAAAPWRFFAFPPKVLICRAGTISKWRETGFQAIELGQNPGPARDRKTFRTYLQESPVLSLSCSPNLNLPFPKRNLAFPEKFLQGCECVYRIAHV